MSDVLMNVSFPLDDDSYFRRECPYCKDEFKINITDKQKNAIVHNLLDNYLSQGESKSGSDKDEDDNDEIEYYCPYCGQTAGPDKWWTKEQLNYAMIYVKNYANKLINEQLINKMKNMSNSFIKFEAKELEYQDPWISPEENDMEIFNLPCCNEKIKLNKDKIKAIYYCINCGFKHTLDLNNKV
jgi:predicted RNA-binding Zn-ribbon protein involved in translation (DUF1610 family)